MSGRTEKEMAKLLGTSKLTVSGVMPWTSRPSLEKLLRKGQQLEAQKTEVESLEPFG